VDNHGLKEELS